MCLGKGKKEEWPDEESDKELKMDSEEDEDILKPVVKSKGNLKVVNRLNNH